MLCVLSPSKDLDLKSPVRITSEQTPAMWERSLEIVRVMKKKKVADLMELMDISEKLATENHRRYQSMETVCDTENARPAVMTFSGDVYRGLDAPSLPSAALEFLEEHCLILSGLYGLLRPLDLMQPYRLEMGTTLPVSRKKNLYAFWTKELTASLKERLSAQKTPVLVNLASQEYFEVIDRPALDADIVQVHFREMRNGKVSFVSYNAKRARGLMARFIALKRIDRPQDLKKFDLEGYAFDRATSTENEYYFIRP